MEHVESIHDRLRRRALIVGNIMAVAQAYPGYCDHVAMAHVDLELDDLSVQSRNYWSQGPATVTNDHVHETFRQQLQRLWQGGYR